MAAAMDNKKLPYKEFRIERLEARHSGLLEKFETDVGELKDFLMEDSINNRQIAISNTYLWFYNPENKLVVYITLLADAIRVHGTQLGNPLSIKALNTRHCRP